MEPYRRRCWSYHDNIGADRELRARAFGRYQFHHHTSNTGEDMVDLSDTTEGEALSICDTKFFYLCRPGLYGSIRIEISHATEFPRTVWVRIVFLSYLFGDAYLEPVS